jgi:hypothetical protein
MLSYPDKIVANIETVDHENEWITMMEEVSRRQDCECAEPPENSNTQIGLAVKLKLKE